MFSQLAVGYLFLGGTGAGGCAVCALLALLVGQPDLAPALESRFRSAEGRLYRSFFSPLLVSSVGALLLGIVCLLADLGQPGRVLLLAFSGKITYLTIGAWALVLCVAVAAFLLVVWRGAVSVPSLIFRAANCLLLVFALVVALYTGLLLSGMSAVPLWNSGVLAALFLASALSCGLALAAGLSAVSEAARTFASTLRMVQIFDVAVIIGEAALVVWWLATVPAAGATPTAHVATASTALLLKGGLAPLFWGGFVAIGLALPLCVEAASVAISGRGCFSATSCRTTFRRETWRRVSLVVAAVAVLAGGFLLRYLVVAAALQPITALVPLL